MRTFKIKDDLYIATQQVKEASASTTAEGMNHVVVLDCSGSMTYDLPKIRGQLKDKLPLLLKPKDTITLIWFSARGEFGTLVKTMQVQTLPELSALNAAIDRWLKPVGLTGFKEPLEEVKRVIAESKNSLPFNLFFLSDGYDNQWQQSEILKAAKDLASLIAAGTVVEFGNYADRKLLTQIAEALGGAVIHAEDFRGYEPQITVALTRQTISNRNTVVCEAPPLDGLVFAIGDDAVLTFSGSGAAQTELSLDADIGQFAYLTTQPQPDSNAGSHPDALTALYATVAVYAQRMKPDVVYPLLKQLGDVALIEQYANCFAKQQYTEFVETATKCVFNKQARLSKGFDQSKVPDENAFTVLDFLSLVSSDPGNKLLLDDPEFSYTRIGRADISASEVLTPADKKELEVAIASLGEETTLEQLDALGDKIQEIKSKKTDGLKFVPDAVDGYPASGITLAETRANVSVLVQKHGEIDLSKTALKLGKLRTSIFRNYSIVRDGIYNVKNLPMALVDSVISALPDGVLTKRDDGTYLVAIDRLPIINRGMVKGVSAKTLLEKEFELLQVQAALKVVKEHRKLTAADEKSAKIADVYGQDGAAWLAERGVTDAGFSPKTTKAPAVDSYMARTLKVSIAGFSSLPSVKDVLKAVVAGKKLTPIQSLLLPYMGPFDPAKPDAPFTLAPNIKDLAHYNSERLRLIRELAEIKFSVLVGQVWFPEFASLEENTLTITVGGYTVAGKIELIEKEEQV